VEFRAQSKHSNFQGRPSRKNRQHIMRVFHLLNPGENEQTLSIQVDLSERKACQIYTM